MYKKYDEKQIIANKFDVNRFYKLQIAL